ncbi:MAG TPA: hypothetical protein ENJ12_10390 [Thiolapillus brandeum]|uniref:Uncharacterized protein n=1 Tax=Thiolapillus brandeum TaxID=1076588 RepID=A0A831RWC0_9GAMM|nr:hypothetical protein [Thiolapillus brandeum]
MFVKSDWGGWLALAAIVVFPSMLYLTRPQTEKAVGSAELASPNETHVLRQNEGDKEPVLPPARVTGNADEAESQAAEWAMSDPDASDTPETYEDKSASDEPEERYSENSEPEDSYQQTFAAPETDQESQSMPFRSATGNRAVTDYMTDSGNAGETAAEAPVSSAVNTGTEENVASAEGVESSFLYTAETEVQPQVTKPSCPPVYMALNDYARNMRIAMGCDSE